MTARKCERCGALYETYDGIRAADNLMESNGIRFIRNARGNLVQTTPLELCPKCMADLADWWNKNKEPEGITRKEA